VQRKRRRRVRLVLAFAAICAVAAAVLLVVIHGIESRSLPRAAARRQTGLPTTPSSYIGLYPTGVPRSNAGVAAFTSATGVRPRVVVYFSGWLEPFQASFARRVAKDGAVPLVQMNPTGVGVAAIASGHYDAYLNVYADAVRAYGHPVILSFGHEMNGYWYSWGYQHTAAAVFVAAWRHIVTLFRTDGVRNVTWLWTVNTIHDRSRVPSPGPWWPGSSYVTWVGIDGYYYQSTSMFTSVFGPTIAAVRALTRQPILIAETAAAPGAGQSTKITDLFAGIHLYGLLGFVWFDSVHVKDWRLQGPAAIAALRRGAQAYGRVAS
jgi:mannan endo-1,4-beta-mannosidase